MIDSSYVQLANKLSLSYELSLSIGQSLQLEEMLQQFISTLVRKTSALRGVVWVIEDDNVKFGAGSGFGVKEIDHTKAPACIKVIFDDLVQEEVIRISQDEHCFESFCYPKTGREKEILLIYINNSLVIHLAYGRVNVIDEGIADIVKTLRPKIYNAVSACVNYQKLLELERKEKDRLESELAQSEERYRLLTENALAGVFLIQNNELRYANPKFAKIFDYHPDQLLDNFLFDSLGVGNYKQRLVQWQENVLKNNCIDNRLEFYARKKDGQVVCCECMGTKTEYNGQPAIVGTLIDITVRKQAESKLTYLATHDNLTGLYNRAYLEKLLDSYKINNNAFPLTVIMCDLDGLKNVNDSLGHQMGDKLLKKAAQILRASLRKTDVLIRYGGDEFVAILPNTSNESGNSLIQRIQENISYYNESASEIPISMSIGVATAQNNNQIAESFLKADTNMYTSKAATLSGLTGRFIKTLVDVLSVRNLETKSHTMRVKDLSVIMGKACSLNEQALSALSLLAMVHDIGKIGIPDSILLKPGRLTADEYTIMKNHTVIGYNIARTLPDLKHVADYILHHHERWDGNGYPHGLRQTEIPLICRILAIVDAYDAMTNDRPYRKGLSKEEALAEIESGSGSQFDPNLTKVFVRLVSKHDY